MKVREIVKALQEQGHEVEFYVRKDGGILIRRIDGENFRYGATGNLRARQLLNVPGISEARQRQLEYATRSHVAKKPTLDEEIEREYKRVKKIWNRRFRSKKGKPHPAGYFGKARISYSMKHYGKEEALRRIREAERYATGIAYSKNVEHLASYVRMAADHLQSDELRKLSKDIMDNAYGIRDEWIYPAYDRLYLLNKGANPTEVAREVRKILRL